MWDAERAVVRLSEGAAVCEVMDCADPAAWTALDEAVRTTFRYRGQRMPALSEVSTDGQETLGCSQRVLALCHPNGRVRAAALERAPGDVALLPLVVVRCADWAEPVRSRARALMRKAMPRLDPAELAAVAPLLLRLGRRHRGDFGEALLREALQALPDNGMRLLIAARDRAVRRLSWRLALARGMFSAAQLAGAAARDEDTVVRRLCADAVIGQVGPGTGDDVLGPLLAARSADTRAVGVTALRRAGRPAQAVGYLADRSSTVRACARYVVRQAGEDPLPLYRAWCTSPRDVALPAGVPVGLAECGDRADAALLWPLLVHPVAGVRAQAVAGLRLLDVVEPERLEPLLADDAPAVARETARALVPYADRLPVDWLTDLLAPGRPSPTRHAAFRLLDARAGLDQLGTAVGLLGDPDAKLRFRAEQSVRRWQLPVGLTEAEATTVTRLLGQCTHLRRRVRC